MEKLSVFINEQNVFEFDKEHVFDEKQLAFLDQMDKNMELGIKIKGELFENPDSNQRAIFVSMNLIKAIQQDNDAAIFASCAYLVNRRSELVEVHAIDYEGSVKIELIE